MGGEEEYKFLSGGYSDPKTLFRKEENKPFNTKMMDFFNENINNQTNNGSFSQKSTKKKTKIEKIPCEDQGSVDSPIVINEPSESRVKKQEFIINDEIIADPKKWKHYDTFIEEKKKYESEDCQFSYLSQQATESFLKCIMHCFKYLKVPPQDVSDPLKNEINKPMQIISILTQCPIKNFLVAYHKADMFVKIADAQVSIEGIHCIVTGEEIKAGETFYGLRLWNNEQKWFFGIKKKMRLVDVSSKNAGLVEDKRTIALVMAILFSFRIDGWINKKVQDALLDLRENETLEVYLDNIDFVLKMFMEINVMKWTLERSFQNYL